MKNWIIKVCFVKTSIHWYLQMNRFFLIRYFYWFPPLFLLNRLVFLVELEYCHVDFSMNQLFLLLIDVGFLFNFRLLQKLDFPTMKFSLYFLAYEEKNDIPKDKDEKVAWVFSRKATLELTQWVWVFIFLYSLHFYKPFFLTYKLDSNLVYLITLHL